MTHHLVLNRAIENSRRLLALTTFLAISVIGGIDEPSASKAETEGIATIRHLAEKAGLKNLGVEETEHYIGIGDAPEGFRKEALEIVCEGLAKTYQKHFATKKIEITMPVRKMNVVILASRKSYEAFKGEVADPSEGGYFDVGANFLVTYDFQAENGADAANRVYNTFTLVHEATHQLTYNTGLLARDADVPVALSEGLAMYGESWKVATPSFGKLNIQRLKQAKLSAGKGSRWIPIAKLLTEDALFDEVETRSSADGESWLLVYDQLQTPAGILQLQRYLSLIKTRHDPAHRLEDAEKAFGDLKQLDAHLKATAKRMR